MSEYPAYETLLNALRKDLREEMDALSVLVNDEDASCPLRSARQERLAAFSYVDRLLHTYENWEW